MVTWKPGRKHLVVVALCVPLMLMSAAIASELMPAGGANAGAAVHTGSAGPSPSSPMAKGLPESSVPELPPPSVPDGAVVATGSSGRPVTQVLAQTISRPVQPQAVATSPSAAVPAVVPDGSVWMFLLCGLPMAALLSHRRASRLSRTEAGR
jgi:hypothetical protein